VATSSYDYTTSGQTYRPVVYTVYEPYNVSVQCRSTYRPTYLYSIHTFLHNIFIYNAIKLRIKSTVSGTIHFHRAVADLLHEHCSSINIITNCMYVSISRSTIAAYINNLFTYFKSAYYVSFPSILTIHQFFIWIALGDADLRFSHYFGNKSHCCCRRSSAM
jgi:hypothetical protein